MITEKRTNAAKLEVPGRAYEACQDKLKKGYSEGLPDENADFTDRGEGALRQYDPKLIRARSWFEGVRCPETSGIGV